MIDRHLALNCPAGIFFIAEITEAYYIMTIVITI
jgi:hypothetical protein